jgi:hypothetical protein
MSSHELFLHEKDEQAFRRVKSRDLLRIGGVE